MPRGGTTTKIPLRALPNVHFNIFPQVPCPPLPSHRHSQGRAPCGSRMEYQQVQDNPCWVIRAASNIGHAQMQQWHSSVSRRITPVCYVNQNRQRIYETFFFFFPETFFFSVKQNKYIQFKIIFSSKKIQIA